MARGRTRVVILGGGYAGVRAAYDLAKSSKKDDLEIILVSASVEHLEVPSLYEVATAYLPHESLHSSELVCEGVSVPLVDLFYRHNVGVKEGQVEQIRPEERLVILKDHSSLSYDYLVVAIGAQVATFNIPGVEEHAFMLKSLADALRVRHRIMHLLLQKKPLTFVVVGGGATGVETAAELSGLIRHVKGDRHLPMNDMKIMLVEAGPDILRETPPMLRAQALERLQKLGVEVMTNRAVEKITETQVQLKDGGSIMTPLAIWAGGLKAHDVLVRSHLPVTAWGLSMETNLRVVGHPEIFAAGDSGVVADKSVRIPATVPVAYTEGALVAKNIVHALAGEPLEDFVYTPAGQLITLGGKQAVLINKHGHGWVGFLPWVAKHAITLRYWMRFLPPWSAWALWQRGIWRQMKND